MDVQSKRRRFGPDRVLHTRIVTGPAYAQEQKSIDEFRQTFGPTPGDRNAHSNEEEVP